jgi:tetratricopeptide (TPR) repeat protein
MAKKSSSVRKAIKPVKKKATEAEKKQVTKNLSTTTVHPADSIARMRELAWTGQHAQATDFATQALSASKIKPAEQMDLLDLRAESYLAQGKFDLAAQDANAMMKLANAEKKPALKALALIRKGTVQGFQEEYETSIRTLTSALKIARKSKQKYLEAESLYRLGETQRSFNLSEQAIHSAQQAADLYLSLDNPSRVGRALAAVAWACFRLGRTEESIHVAQAAVTLCEQTGDNLGKGSALNALQVNEIDLALALKHLKEAYQAPGQFH